MPQVDGLQATAMVRALPNPPAVLIFTTFALDEVAMRAVQAGASGFLLKTTGPHELVEKVHAVARGEGVVSSEMVPSLFDALRHGSGGSAAAQAVGQLTDRELEVSCVVAQGATNGAIARDLYISETTVKTHLMGAQNKLGVRTRVEVAVLIAKAGLLD